MILPLLLLGAASLPFICVRWARWLAIVQQKEYRLDRLFAFFDSTEGKREVARVLPVAGDFSRTGMKRPHITSRVVFVAVLSGLVLLVAAVLGSLFALGQQSVIFSWLVVLAVLYVVVPLFVILACLPSTLISWYITWKTLRQAQSKVQQGKPQIIGVGGSYGKTSTKHLVHHFLSQAYTVFVTPKSFNTKFSVAQSICSGYKNQEIALLEYGAYIRGEIEYLARWFRPSIAIETGFTPQHLSLFGTRENSILAESELLAALPKDGIAFCNGADAGAVEICERGVAQSGARVVHYAGEDSVVQLHNVRLNPFGQLEATWKGHHLKTQLIGRQYQVNLQAAIAVAQHLKLSDQQIETAARTFQPSSSFIQGKILQTGAYIIDDGGTSNPKGFEAALTLLEELPYTEKILLTTGMIDLGDESHQIHLELAERAQQMGVRVIHVGVDGKEEFAQVFGDRLMTSTTEAKSLLQSSHKEMLILLEGKVPKVLEDLIEELTERIV